MHHVEVEVLYGRLWPTQPDDDHAGVSLAEVTPIARVGIDLVWVGDRRAIVTGIADAILVAILLA